MPSSTALPLHDVIGVGFGPSNLALAIALEELAGQHGKPLDALFLDKQAQYRWHGDTLASQSELQISFLKDLVSMRNPTSPYSFVNYLKQQQRLVDFINLGTFYPCRMEFNDYLGWVAEQFASQARYGEEVLRIEPQPGAHGVEHLRVVSRDSTGQEYARLARAVVVATGGTPRIPALFNGFKGNPRVFHHSSYLSALAKLPCSQGSPMRIAIVGSGQSAAEAFIDLNDSFPSVNVDMIVRASALKPADDTPFVNEVFAPATTDLVFGKDADARRQHLREYQNTNYSVVDHDLIDRIYNVLYRQKVSRRARHAVLCRHQVEAAVASDSGIELRVRNLDAGTEQNRHYDAVILATGYERNAHQRLLEPLAAHLGELNVSRDYRAHASPELKAAVFLQGFCETSHGLSDTLLSVLPMRSEEIGQALYRSLGVATPSAAGKLAAVARA